MEKASYNLSQHYPSYFITHFLNCFFIYIMSNNLFYYMKMKSNKIYVQTNHSANSLKSMAAFHQFPSSFWSTFLLHKPILCKLRIFSTKKVFIYSSFVFLTLDSAEVNTLCVLIFMCKLLLSSIKQPYLNRSISI